MGNAVMETAAQFDARISRLQRFESDLQYLADKTWIGNRPEAEEELIKIRAEIVYVTAQKKQASGRTSADMAYSFRRTTIS
ncbi:MAG TPA: hypothetical protein VGF88_20050 [Acidobacteriaceae bacterium]|jgi:hypothetical protein